VENVSLLQAMDLLEASALLTDGHRRRELRGNVDGDSVGNLWGPGIIDGRDAGRTLEGRNSRQKVGLPVRCFQPGKAGTEFLDVMSELRDLGFQKFDGEEPEGCSQGGRWPGTREKSGV
jgi:hypothetical protein